MDTYGIIRPLGKFITKSSQLMTDICPTSRAFVSPSLNVYRFILNIFWVYTQCLV